MKWANASKVLSRYRTKLVINKHYCCWCCSCLRISLLWVTARIPIRLHDKAGTLDLPVAQDEVSSASASLMGRAQFWANEDRDLLKLMAEIPASGSLSVYLSVDTYLYTCLYGDSAGHTQSHAS